MSLKMYGDFHMQMLCTFVPLNMEEEYINYEVHYNWLFF